MKNAIITISLALLAARAASAQEVGPMNSRHFEVTELVQAALHIVLEDKGLVIVAGGVEAAVEDGVARVAVLERGEPGGLGASLGRGRNSGCRSLPGEVRSAVAIGQSDTRQE